MITLEHDMFRDRRKKNRRRRDLSIPQKLNRRASSDRRAKAFSSQPWWLQVNYACEYQEVTEEEADHQQRKEKP